MLISFEKELFNKGHRYIVGIDEVGRGPLDGPVVVAAVILDLKKIMAIADRKSDVSDEVSLINYERINDSKKITKKRRGELDIFIRNASLDLSISEIDNEIIDEIGIAKSIEKATLDSLSKLKITPSHYLTDFLKINSIEERNQTNIVKGDGKSISIAAASIIAKVYRDSLMDKFHLLYPNYGFDKHKGYGTKIHINAIKDFGYCEIHRKSFNIKPKLI